MNMTIKTLAVAIAAATLATPALAADEVKTKGGFQIKSEDGNFEFKLGGRIHFDGNFYASESDISSTSTVQNIDKANSQFFFRRARLSLEGRAYDWNFKFENDFANSNENQGTNSATASLNGSAGTKANEGFREMWIGRKVLGDNNLRLGQAKPYRGMEELTSSNEITFMERPFATATGIYQNQFTMGAFLDGSGEGYGYGVSVFTPRSAADSEAQGLSYNARGFIVPVRSNGNVVHIGLSATQDNFETSNVNNRNLRVVGRENGLRSGDLLKPTLLAAGGVANAAFNEQTTIAAELAARFGAFSVQGEYADATFKDNRNVVVTNGAPVIANADDQKLAAYYVQASYFLTGHERPYDFKKGVFKSPKVNGEDGAIELKARFDKIENKDIDNVEASYYTVGVNYYATPNTRFMVEYVDGNAKNVSGVTKTDLDASAITARAQYNF